MKSIIWLAKVSLTCSLGMLLYLSAAGSLTNLARAEATTDQPFSIVRPGTQQPLSVESVLKKIARVNVVYLGETHDRPEDHQAQLTIIQALHRLNPQLVVGMEMFQRPYQPVIDRYLAGKITEAELIEQSQYPKRWGFPWEFYAPIVRFARDKGLPVIALNTLTEVTRKVARSGLESLTLAEKRFIPPNSAIALGPVSYRQRLGQIYDDIHHGKTSQANFERFFQAQVLWDETMAERIAQSLQQEPKRLVVVLVGQGHVVYGDGIPSRVARRVPKVSQVSILLNPPEEFQNQKEGAIADYFWFTFSGNR
ncbi:ChaN family lipoprotein [Leptothermofonsia sp. ETS-13]|uniref:ChaN family lipoprotein n=1 Tax=Leptothermofonsia sp. ETS-13 TaxID=3035696 RepID=UPI003BA33B9B